MSMNKEDYNRLVSVFPCTAGKVWAAEHDDLQTAWDACERGDWMAWWLGMHTPPEDTARILVEVVRDLLEHTDLPGPRAFCDTLSQASQLMHEGRFPEARATLTKVDEHSRAPGFVDMLDACDLIANLTTTVTSLGVSGTASVTVSTAARAVSYAKGLDGLYHTVWIDDANKLAARSLREWVGGVP